MKSSEKNGIPEFKSLEEEKEYWEARGPLAEGHKGTVNRPKSRQKRSSFLAVRLTGEELTRLRDVAAGQGLGPSTYARMILTSALERGGKPDIGSIAATLAELHNDIRKIEGHLSLAESKSGQYAVKDGLSRKRR